MPPSPAGPVPIAARYFTAAARAEIDFDAPLQAGVKFPGNWSFRLAGVGAGCNSAVIGMPFHRVVCSMMLWGPPDPGPSVVSYSAGVPDIIRQADGVPASPFTDFPVTILP